MDFLHMIVSILNTREEECKTNSYLTHPVIIGIILKKVNHLLFEYSLPTTEYLGPLLMAVA